MKIVVVGGGPHAKVVISVLRKLRHHRVLGYTDLKDMGEVLSAPYLGTDDQLVSLASSEGKLGAVLAVGQVGLGKKRQEIWSRLAGLPMQFPVIISPDATFNKNATADEGVVIMDGAVVNCGAMIGRGVIVNTNSTVEHDVVLADWVHVAPGATICGGSKIGRYSMVGAGATVIEGVSITEGCMIGAGATVVKDLTNPGVYIGCPARRLEQDSDV